MMAERAGIPPSRRVTSIAIGVVADFGDKDKITGADAPSACATSTTDTTPVTHATSCDTMIGSACRRICSHCWYSGTPSATIAGLSSHSR